MSHIVDTGAIHEKGHKAVDLFPKKVFDSPYVDSFHGSGVVTIEKGDRKLTLDFTHE